MRTIIGAVELGNILKTLPTRVQTRILGPALREGAKIVADEARRLAPVANEAKHGKYAHSPGQLKASIKVRAGKHRRNERKMLAMTGSGFYVGNEFYGGFVEYGHGIGKASSAVRSTQESIRKAKRSGGDSAKLTKKLNSIETRGRVEAKPFLRPAFDNTKGLVSDRVMQRIKSGVIAEAFKAKSGSTGGGEVT